MINLLVEEANGKVKIGDLVIFDSYDGKVLLVVREEVPLTDKDQYLKVSAVCSVNIRQVVVNKLLTESQGIVVVPSYLYSVEDDSMMSLKKSLLA